MPEEKKGKNYKSPQRKLVKFFEKSRDQWKEKSLKAKAKVKQLSNRVRFLENSKEQLKNEIKALEAELAQTKKETETEPQKKS